MSEIKKNVDEALALLSTLSVSGDAVDVMAIARAKLKAASKALEDTDG